MCDAFGKQRQNDSNRPTSVNRLVWDDSLRDNDIIFIYCLVVMYFRSMRMWFDFIDWEQRFSLLAHTYLFVFVR